MKLLSLDHLVLTTRNVEACLAFYTGILNMEPVRADGRTALRFGAQKINIHTRPGEFQPAAGNPTPGSQDFCLVAEGEIAQIRAEIEAKGWPIELGPVERTGALGPIDSLYLRDPDGNLVEIAVYRKREP